MKNLITISLALVCGLVAAFAAIAQCGKVSQSAILIGLVFVLIAQVKIVRK